MTGRWTYPIAATLALVGLAIGGWVRPVSAQDVRVRDLTIANQAVPTRLMGYGIVVGLDGTGDRAIGGFGAVHTVRSVVNLLRRFDIEVPERVLRTRNVAAVLVTAEISPYLRPGGRFDVQVSSLGDAASLRGGVLWSTPLVPQAGSMPVATAQGPVVVSEGGDGPNRYVVETSVRVPGGGVLEIDQPRPDFAGTSRILLREPNLGTASRIAGAINEAFGEGSARVEDPGAIALAPPDDMTPAAFLTQVGELRVEPDRRARIIVDSRDGTVVAGGGLQVGEAVVSHGAVTLSVSETAPPEAAPGAVTMAPGVSVQDVAAALHAIAAPPRTIAAIFESLREVGAISAEIVVR